MTDEITTGELGRRMDEVRDMMREMVGRVDYLDSRFVPRRELDERHRLLDVQYLGLEGEVRANHQALDNYKREVVSARRWAIATLLSTVLALLAVAASFLQAH